MAEGSSPGEIEEVTAELRRSLCIEDEDKMETYHRLIQNGKEVARQGDLHKGLDFFKKAYKIHQSQKLEGRIKKIEELLSENDSEEDEEFVNINNSGLMLYKELHEKLYHYQKEGVAFLYSLYRDKRRGGILADDMGLGKTIQVISFLSAMYDSELIKHTLLVMPTSLITNWTKEFAKWTPGMRVKEFHGVSKGERTRNLEKVQRRNGVIITTYTMLMNNWQQLASYHGREFTWDYMILDEAHKIKTTTTKTAKSAYAVPSKNRILLTGTPVQNNLREMWALFDFACQGTLLGTAKTFKSEYENPITRAREKDATPGEMALGSRISENLMTIINPYFLRRTKDQVQKKNSCNDKGSQEEDKILQNHQTNSGVLMPKLTRKNDLIIWVYLSSAQADIYRQFLSLDHVKELLMTVRSPLAELNLLKKLCDHPRLLSSNALAKLGLEEDLNEDSEGDAQSIAHVADNTLIAESGKLSFLFELLECLRREGHRTLVFAHYRKVLDIIERILGHRGFKVLRLDGTVTQIAERERRISLFQTDSRYSVFLLTTQVGGVGITLTAANRVVIYDPSWNPATDAQAVDRAYRIGQKENVIIYRLITCGTVEEKIYRRQVFKDSLIRQNTGDKKNPFRYFSKQELKELFILEDTRSSATQMQLQALHSQHRRSDPSLDLHITQLHSMDMFGISDHDLMFSLDVNHDGGPESQEETHYIEGRVQKAEELMKAESVLQMQLADSVGSSTEAAWLRLQADNQSRERSNRPKASPVHSQNGCCGYDSGSPDVVDQDSTGSGKTVTHHSHEVIDLTEEESTTEEQYGDFGQEKLESPKKESFYKLEESMTGGEEQEVASFGKQTASSVFESAAGSADVPKQDPAADEEDLTQTPALNHRVKRLSEPVASPLHNKLLSTSQAPCSNSRASSRISTGFQSYNSNFDLKLEDSDMFADMQGPEAKEKMLQLEDSDIFGEVHDPEVEEKKFQLEDSDIISDVKDPEAKEEKLKVEDFQPISDHSDLTAEEEELLSRLQMDGSFDVSKSLSEMHMKEGSAQSFNHGPEGDVSMDESIVATKRKRAAVIYDSDSDEEEQEMVESCLQDSSFQDVEASTPKSATSSSVRLRRSVGGNVSVASQRSLLQSFLLDLEEDEQEEDEDEQEEEEDEQEEEEDEQEEEDSEEDDNYEEEADDDCDWNREK